MMIAPTTSAGLILSTSRARTATFDELVSGCGWPAVLQATPARLRRDLLLANAEVSFLWLESRDELAATVRLLTWLKATHPTVRRWVVTYGLAADQVEPPLRSAGVHMFVPCEGSVRRMAQDLSAQCMPHEERLTARVLSPKGSAVVHSGLVSASCIDRSPRVPP